MGMLNHMAASAPISLEQSLAAYKSIVSQFGNDPIVRPGRIEILGWDLEYVCASALASFVDQILVRRLNDFSPDNDRPVILDCGANIGLSVLNYKRRFPKAKIVAFEPDPQFASALHRNLDRNSAADVEVVEAAAWIRSGTAKWFCEGRDGSKLVDWPQTGPDTTVVRTVDLADYLVDPVDLLKLDIEGAEYQVIAHLGDRLDMVKNALIECHLDQSNIVHLAKMLEVLAASRFRLTVNSFGRWRDLIRQLPVDENHWEQYLLVAAWRNDIPLSPSEDALLPYGGASSALELQTLQSEAEDLRVALRAARSQLYALVAGRHSLQCLPLNPPFKNDEGFCWVAELPGIEDNADNENHPERSSLLLLEGDKLLGPAHTLHADIRKSGSGRYSHWKSCLYFSTPDSTDPNTNGREYQIVFAGPV